MPDDHLLLVLHTLRLVGFADTEVVVRRTGLAPTHVEPTLHGASASGWATYRDGRLTGWSLTVVGRAHGESLLARELDELGARDAVLDAYRSCRDLNQAFLDLCTDWQLRPAPDGALVVNDHTDSVHDERVVSLLGAMDDRIQPILATLGRSVERFGGYAVRLDAARRRIETGERDWFTRPVIDSYHTVWFELHEDLLATLGLDRSSEH